MPGLIVSLIASALGGSTVVGMRILLETFLASMFLGGIVSTCTRAAFAMRKKMIITNNIRRLRFFADEMTQLELAEKAAVSRQTIVALEAGKYTPNLELAFRIADVFGVSINEVFECRPDGNGGE